MNAKHWWKSGASLAAGLLLATTASAQSSGAGPVPSGTTATDPFDSNQNRLPGSLPSEDENVLPPDSTDSIGTTSQGERDSVDERGTFGTDQEVPLNPGERQPIPQDDDSIGGSTGTTTSPGTAPPSTNIPQTGSTGSTGTTGGSTGSSGTTGTGSTGTSGTTP